jgi:hypothetical protein
METIKVNLIIFFNENFVNALEYEYELKIAMAATSKKASGKFSTPSSDKKRAFTVGLIMRSEAIIKKI